jgi:hypothetical protein
MKISHGIVCTSLSLALSALAFSPANAQEESLTCWGLLTDEVSGVVNTVILCSTGSKAEMTIYFPNAGWDSTQCVSAGAESLTGQTIDFVFEGGSCQNGRTLGPARLSCLQSEDQALACDDHEGHQLEFTRLGGRSNSLPNFPIGLRVEHSPNPVRAMEGGRSGRPFTWAYRTTVSAIDDTVRILEFGAFSLVDGEWILGTVTGHPFTATDFAEWYGCPDAIVRPGISCTDANNWSGDQQLRGQKARWYYFGLTEDGRQVMGWAEIEELPELVSESDDF